MIAGLVARRALVVALVSALICALALAFISPAQAAMGTISGTVTAEVGGAPLDGIEVVIYEEAEDDPGWYYDVYYTETNSDGTYSVSVPSSGTYRVGFATDDDVYDAEYWNASENVADVADADDVSPPSTGKNATLKQLRLANGFVKDSTGNEVENVQVTVAATAAGSVDRQTDTGADGEYRLPINTGTTSYVCFEALGFVTQCLNNKPDRATSDPIAAGTADVTNNVTLVALHAITGTVTGPTGAPLKDVYVDVSDDVVEGDGKGQAITNANGTYSLKLPPDTYKVHFREDGFYSEYFNDKITFATADPVVLSGSADFVANAQLTATVPVATTTISGVVKDDTDALLAGIEVYVDDVGSATTQADGTYSLVVPQGGTYTVHFSHPDGLYAPEDSDPVMVTTVPVAHVDAELSDDGIAEVHGTVTKAVGVPLADIEVTLYEEDDPDEWISSTSIYTKANGTFAVGVPPGDYKIGYRSDDGSYREAFYNNEFTLDDATSFSVAADSQNDKSIQLTAADAIKGKVTVPAGYSVQDVEVIAWSGCCDEFSARPDADGNYAIGLEDGTYRLAFVPYNQLLGTRFFDGTTNGSTDSFEALPIVLNGADVPGKNITLAATGGISGQIFAPAGFPLVTNVVVYRKINGHWKSQFTQGFEGSSYAIPLKAGTYRLKFNDENHGFDPIFWDNAFTFGAATDIVVGSTPVTGKDVYFGGRPVVQPPPPAAIPPRFGSSFSGSVKGGKKKATVSVKVRFANVKTKKVKGSVYVFEGSRIVKKGKFTKGKGKFKVKAKKGLHTYTVVFNGGANYGVKTFTRTVNVK